MKLQFRIAEGIKHPQAVCLIMICLVVGMATSAYAVPPNQVERDARIQTFTGFCCRSWNETVASQITNAVGEVVFTSLVPTTYTVCEVLQANWYTITPAALDPTYGMPCYTISLSPAKTIAVVFGDSTTKP